MPELPDVDVYVDTIWQNIEGTPLVELRIGNPFLVRSIEPSPGELAGQVPTNVRRIGKRIAIGLEGEPDELFLLLHLMIAGRLRWRDGRCAILLQREIPCSLLTIENCGAMRFHTLLIA